MRKITVPILFVSLFLMACGRQQKSGVSSDINPRDTVVVPEGYTGEDSIAYIEDAILKTPISAEDLLGLAEVHSFEGWLHYYNNPEEDQGNNDLQVTKRDSTAVRFANRFMRMAELARASGNANDMLQWTIAVNSAIEDFRKVVPSLSPDSTISEISRVMDKFSSLTQTEMNYHSYVYSMIDCYRTIEAYRRLIEAVPSGLKPLVKKEFEAWYDLNDARYSFWDEVSYNQEWYSMKPLELNGYYGNLFENRCAELEVERGILLEGKSYQQKGKTVTAQQWENWIKDRSVPEDIESLKELDMKDRIPSDSLVTAKVGSLKSTFSKWLATRQAIVEALPEEQGKSYDFLTADIHSRFIGKLPDLIPFGEE